MSSEAPSLAQSASNGEGQKATAGAGHGMWPLTNESREKIVSRIAQNLAAISFFSAGGASSTGGGGGSSSNGPASNGRLDDEAAREHAVVIEREAFQSAQELVQRGAQERAESAVVLAYAQHASDAMIALLKAKMGSAKSGDAPAPVSAGGPEVVLDLSLDGKRDFVKDRASAEALLKDMLTGGGNSHTKVRLSTKCWFPEACGVVAQALRNCAGSLRHADLSDIIAGQPEEKALQALAEITGALAGVPLLSLDLSNNALGEKGVRACAAVLTSQRGLESLSFCNNGISKEAGEAIVELLHPECVQSLTTLHFYNNMTGEEGAKVLAELVGTAAQSRLRDLRFSSTRVQTEGAVALAEALGKGTGLERLDMRDNMFGEEGAAALAQHLPKHPNLKELILGDTLLGEEGSIQLVEAMSGGCQQLRELDLSGNDLSAEGAQRLGMALEGLPQLQRLLLSCNELGDEGAETLCLAVAKHCTNLEELDLSTNEISDKGAKAAAEAVCELPSLTVLNVNGNAISKAAVEQIKGILRSRSPHGESVLGPLDENDDGEEDAE